MTQLWSKSAASLAIMAAFGFLSGRAMGAPPPPADNGHPAAKEATPGNDKDTQRNVKDADRDRDAGDGDRSRGAAEKRDADRDTRDAVRDTQEKARDTARDAKDTAHDTKDAARDERDRRSDDRRDTSDDRDRDRDRDQHGTARDGDRGHRSGRDLGLSFGRMTDRGLTIGRLAADSVIAKAGLRDSDVIVSVNGHRLRDEQDFDRYVFSGPRRDRVKIIVLRDDREEVVYLEPTMLYTEEATDRERPYFGIDFDNRYPDRIVILRVYPDSPAFAAGLRAGDELSTWNGERIRSVDDFMRTIRGTQPGAVKFEYLRDSKRVGGEARFNRREAKRDARK